MVTQTSHDFTVGGDYTRVSIPKGKAHRGPSWRLATTPNKPRHPIPSAKHKDWGPWAAECSRPHSNTAYTSAPNGWVLHQGPKQGFCLLPNLFILSWAGLRLLAIYPLQTLLVNRFCCCVFRVSSLQEYKTLLFQLQRCLGSSQSL